MAAPFLLPFLVGAGVGGWGLSQADDAIETVTGERGGVPWLQLALFIGLVLTFYMWTKKK